MDSRLTSKDLGDRGWGWRVPGLGSREQQSAVGAGKPGQTQVMKATSSATGPSQFV